MDTMDVRSRLVAKCDWMGRAVVSTSLLIVALTGLLVTPAFVLEARGQSGSCSGSEPTCTGQCCGSSCISVYRTCCSRWNGSSWSYSSCGVGDGCCNGSCCPSNQCAFWEGNYQCCSGGQVSTGSACCDPGDIGCDNSCCDPDSYQCCYDYENEDYTCPECEYPGWPGYLFCSLCDGTPTDGNNAADTCLLCDSDWDGTKDSCYLCDKTPTDANNVNDDCYLCDNPTHGSDPNDQNNKVNDCYLCDSKPDANNINDACMLCDDPYHATDPTNQKDENNSCYPCKNKTNGPQNDDCYRCDTKKADGTPGKDGKNDACYVYDTDGDGIKDSCCPTFRVELTFTDDFTDRSKSSAGVGETGEVVAIQANGQTMGAVTYTTSDATCVALSGNDWTASDHNCSAQLCAEANGCKQCKTLTVKEPSGITMQQAPGTCTKHVHNTGSAGFMGEFFITPVDVSFNAIQRKEGHCLGIGTGYYAPDNGLPHPAGTIWRDVNKPASTGPEVGKGSKAVSIDQIYSGTYTRTPYSDGTFTWPIPQEWKLGTKTGLITTTSHKETINANGDLTISKGGTSKTAAFGDANSDFYDNPCVLP